MNLRSATFDFGELGVCFDGGLIRIQGDDGDLICFVNPLLSGQAAHGHATGRAFKPCTSHSLQLLRGWRDKQKEDFGRLIVALTGEPFEEVTP